MKYTYIPYIFAVGFLSLTISHATVTKPANLKQLKQVAQTLVSTNHIKPVQTIFNDNKVKAQFTKELQDLVKEGLLSKKYDLPQLAEKIKALIEKYNLHDDFADIVNDLFDNMKSYSAWQAFVNKIINDKRYFQILRSGMSGAMLVTKLHLNKTNIDQFVRSYATQP